MDIKHKVMDRVMGWIFIILGGWALFEARRIFEMESGRFVGDHTFPLILGILFVIFGVYFQFVTEMSRVHFPQGTALRRMIWTALVLLAYWQSISIIGYTIVTFMASSALFVVIGNYKWHISILAGLLTTAVLYFIFRVWLYLPFPGGFLGF